MAQRRYEIVRYYRDRNKPCEVQKQDVSLEEAQAHCQDTKSRDREAGWFDGYRLQLHAGHPCP